MWALLFLLLPVAAYSGWAIGRRSLPSKSYNLVPKYFTGLNCLNDNQDKDIDTLLKFRGNDEEMVETNIYIGSLFRSCGDVSKAIRVHQGLLKQKLSTRIRSLISLELARDYISSGMLDRGESILIELVASGEHLSTSLQYLLDIYQQGKEWEAAIDVAQRLTKVTKKDNSLLIAQFNCELAEIALTQKNLDATSKYLKQSLQANSNCVRAFIGQGNLEQADGNFKIALKSYLQVVENNVDYFSEVLPMIAESYKQLNNHAGFEQFLKNCIKQHPNNSVILAFADLLKENNLLEATVFITEYLKVHPSIHGIQKLLELNTPADGTTDKILHVVRDILAKLLNKLPSYRCDSCGFTANKLEWHCPSCKQWEKIKPVLNSF